MQTWRFWNRTRESHRELSHDPLDVKREQDRPTGNGPAQFVRRCAGRTRDIGGQPGSRGVAVYVDNFR